MEQGMDDDKMFCTQCGAVMGEGDQFCPSCGAKADGAPNPYRESPASRDSESLNTTRILILLYGIFASVFGILALAGSTMLNDPSMQQAMIDAGFNVNMNDLAATVALESVVLLASGLCAIVSSYFVGKRTNYTLALVLCIAASALSLIMFPIGIVTLLVGLYVAYRVKSAQSLFS